MALQTRCLWLDTHSREKLDLYELLAATFAEIPDILTRHTLQVSNHDPTMR